MIEQVECKKCVKYFENCITSIKYIQQDLPIIPASVTYDNCFSYGETRGRTKDRYHELWFCWGSSYGSGGGGLSLNAFANANISMYSDDQKIYADVQVSGCGGMNITKTQCRAANCILSGTSTHLNAYISCSCDYDVYFDFSYIPNLEHIAVEYTITMSASGSGDVVCGDYKYPIHSHQHFQDSYVDSQTERYIVHGSAFNFHTFISIRANCGIRISVPSFQFHDYCNQHIRDNSASINCSLNIDLTLTGLIKVEY